MLLNVLNVGLKLAGVDFALPRPSFSKPQGICVLPRLKLLFVRIGDASLESSFLKRLVSSLTMFRSRTLANSLPFQVI